MVHPQRIPDERRHLGRSGSRAGARHVGVEPPSSAPGSGRGCAHAHIDPAHYGGRLLHPAIFVLYCAVVSPETIRRFITEPTRLMRRSRLTRFSSSEIPADGVRARAAKLGTHAPELLRNGSASTTAGATENAPRMRTGGPDRLERNAIHDRSDGSADFGEP